MGALGSKKCASANIHDIDEMLDEAEAANPALNSRGRTDEIDAMIDDAETEAAKEKQLETDANKQTASSSSQGQTDGKSSVQSETTSENKPQQYVAV